MPGILGVELAIGTDGERSVSRAQREIQEVNDAGGGENASVPLRQNVEISIFTFSVDVAVRIHRRHVDAPLEAIGVVRDAAQRAISIAMAEPTLPGGGSAEWSPWPASDPINLTPTK
jgi:hypothetical protein